MTRHWFSTPLGVAPGRGNRLPSFTYLAVTGVQVQGRWGHIMDQESTSSNTYTWVGEHIGTQFKSCNHKERGFTQDVSLSNSCSKKTCLDQPVQTQLHIHLSSNTVTQSIQHDRLDTHSRLHDFHVHKLLPEHRLIPHEAPQVQVALHVPAVG